MENILRSADNAARLLQLTSDTMILIDRNGICVDIAVCNNKLWYLKEENILGKNIFKLIPNATYKQVYQEFTKVLTQKVHSSGNYTLTLDHTTYHFKCIMHPYDEMVLCQYRDITERSLRKEELEKRNNELYETQKAARIGKFRYESNTDNIYYSGYTSVMCSPEEQKTTIQEYMQNIIPEDLSTFKNWVEQSLEEALEDSIDYRLRFGDCIHYLRLKMLTREKHPDGNTTVEGYVQNITDIKKSKNDINLLTHAINHSTEEVFAASQDGTLYFANKRFKEHHNIGASEDIAQINLFDLQSCEANVAQWKAIFTAARNEKKDQSFILYNPILNHPEFVAFEGHAYQVTSDEGVETVWAFEQDISQRILQEQRSKWFSQVLDNTIDHLPASIVVKDINNDFKYLYHNREFYHRNLKMKDSVGKDDFDFHSQESAQKKREQDIYIAQTGTEMHWTAEELDAEGNSIYLDKRKIKIESEDFPPMLLSIEWDITELERMKRELMVAKEKAETSDRLKSAFLANMSHEIRTPLNAIVGFSRIIADSPSAEERGEYYEIVEANNERLLKLINEILDLSKIESGIVEFVIAPIRLHPLCEEIYNAHLLRCPDGVTLVHEPSDESIVIDGDKNRLFQVISNLIGNAFKFTTTGKISYGYHREGDNVVFHVTDTGLGIAADKLGRIFERFVKVNTFAQGTGLGLSICKTIIERLGGTISAASELGTGTTFTFILPLLSSEKVQQYQTPIEEIPAYSPTDSGSATSKESPSQEGGNDADTPKHTILIAEDTDCNFILAKAILGNTYHLHRAIDGMEAVTMYEQLRPDLILMDMKMPNLDGLDATKIIRELSPDVPIIALTAYAYESDRQAAFAAGCNDFLTKPYTQDRIKKAIKKWLK